MQSLQVLAVLLFGVFVGAAPQPATAPVDSNHVGWSLESAPNPIASFYPTVVTGTTNGTFFIVPIAMATVRSLIPAKWQILSTAIREQYPDFPSQSYPLIIHTAQDHDLEVGRQVAVPDFPSIRILFPFVDYLGDGYTSFTYSKYILVPSTQKVSQGALNYYGNIPISVTFTPEHEAYELLPGYAGPNHATQIKALTVAGELAASVEAQEYHGYDQIPFPLSFLVNVTNQFGLSDNEVCHNQRSFFNYSLSAAATPVVGCILLPAPYVLPTKSLNVNDVHGMQVNFAWIENWNISCKDAQGYGTTS